MITFLINCGLFFITAIVILAFIGIGALTLTVVSDLIVGIIDLVLYLLNLPEKIKNKKK